MAQVLRMRIAKLASMPGGFSRAPSPPICRPYRPRRSSLSSISRPPRCLASPSQPLCSAAPTRLSNEAARGHHAAWGAVAWPLVARAQQRQTALIGVLSGRSPDESAQLMAAFHAGLGETGYFEGKNLTIEPRWAEGRE